jgi:hypothetical protein
VLSDAKDIMLFLFSVRWYCGGGVYCGTSSAGLGLGFEGTVRFGGGVIEPEDLDIEDEDVFLLCLGRTQPDVVAGPRGVRDSSGADWERVCLGLPTAEEGFLVLRFRACFSRCLVGLEGLRAREERDSRCESWEKVSMAWIRDALERLRRAW